MPAAAATLQPRVEVELAQPGRLRAGRREAARAGLHLAVHRRCQGVRRRRPEQALERRLERHPRRVRPRRRVVRARHAQRALDADHPAGRQAAAGRAQVQVRRARRGGVERRRVQLADQRLEAPLGPRGELPGVVDRQPQRAGGRRAPGRVQLRVVGHGLPEAGLDADGERGHQAGQVGGAGLELAGADEPGAGPARVGGEGIGGAGAGGEPGDLRVRPRPRLREVRQLAGRVVEFQHRERAAGLQAGRVAAPDRHQHEPRPQPRPGRAGGGGREQPREVRARELDLGHVAGLEAGGARRRVAADDLRGVHARDVARPVQAHGRRHVAGGVEVHRHGQRHARGQRGRGLVRGDDRAADAALHPGQERVGGERGRGHAASRRAKAGAGALVVAVRVAKTSSGRGSRWWLGGVMPSAVTRACS